MVTLSLLCNCRDISVDINYQVGYILWKKVLHNFAYRIIFIIFELVASTHQLRI